MLLWREKAKDREAERQNLLLNQMTNCYATTVPYVKITKHNRDREL